MSAYTDSLWTTATTDEAADRLGRQVSAGFAESGPVGATLISAVSEADFDNRLALSEGSLRSIATKVAPDAPEAVLEALRGHWASQWRTAHRERQMQRQAGARELIAWGKSLFRETPRSWDEWVVRAGEFIQARDYAYTDGEATATNGPDALYALAAVLAAAKAAGVTTALELSEYAVVASGMPGIFGSKEAINAPYRIKERDGKFLVVNDAGETKGTHETWDDARQHQKAMYKNVPGAPEMAKDKKQKREQESKAASAVGPRRLSSRPRARRTALIDGTGRTWNPGYGSALALGRASWDILEVSDDGLSGFGVGRGAGGRIFWRRKSPGMLHTITDDGMHASEKVLIHEIDTVVIDGSVWGVPGKKIGTGIVGLIRDQAPGYRAGSAEANGLRYTASRSKTASTVPTVTDSEINRFLSMLLEIGYSVDRDEAHDLLLARGGFAEAMDSAGIRQDYYDDVRGAGGLDGSPGFALSAIVETTSPADVIRYSDYWVNQGKGWGSLAEAQEYVDKLRTPRFRERAQKALDDMFPTTAARRTAAHDWGTVRESTATAHPGSGRPLLARQPPTVAPIAGCGGALRPVPVRLPGVCPECGAGTSDGRCDDPQGCGWGWEGSDRGLTFDGEPRIVWGSRKAEIASDDDAPASPSSSPIPEDRVAQGQVDAGSVVVGDVLIDVKGGVAVTYTVSAAERQEGDILLSVKRDDGESMDLLMPASSPVQVVQGRGPDDPIPEDKKSDAKGDDEAKPKSKTKKKDDDKSKDKAKKKPKKKSSIAPAVLGEVMGGALRTLGYGDGYGEYVTDYLDEDPYEDYLDPTLDELTTEVPTDIPVLPEEPEVEAIDPTLANRRTR